MLVFTPNGTAFISSLVLEKIKLYKWLEDWVSISECTLFLLRSVFLHLFPGRRLDHVLLNADGIRGFPVVLQQISKILNYPLVSAGQTKSGELLFSLFFSPGLGILGQRRTSCFLSPLLSIESVEEKGGSLPRCSIAELLQMCWPSLTEDCVASHTTHSQQLDRSKWNSFCFLFLQGMAQNFFINGYL